MFQKLLKRILSFVNVEVNINENNKANILKQRYIKGYQTNAQKQNLPKTKSPCGYTITRGSKARHEKAVFHQLFGDSIGNIFQAPNEL